MMSPTPPRRKRRAQSSSASSSATTILMMIAGGFLFGCILTTTLLLSVKVDQGLSPHIVHSPHHMVDATQQQQQSAPTTSTTSILSGLRILIAIASFDFSQLPHLEETLEGYMDLCVTGASKVDIVIHSTMPYPLMWIDLFNTRVMANENAICNVNITLVSPNVRLHLVDIHRPLFYEHVNDYDLFIYTEDDIKVSAKTVAAYWYETKQLQQLVGLQESWNYNVGIVRYEYNFPSNVVMDDKHRHATQNVTRVYWEHSYHFPALPKVVDFVPNLSNYVHMKNHHQGMFLATRDLLLAWSQKCHFDIVTDRPGGHSQPSEGTQRVWMSSQQLYGGAKKNNNKEDDHHCGIQQVLPLSKFGTLTCLHLPNKNYRRVGHFRNRTFSDGTEQFDMGAPELTTAMGLHIELRREELRIRNDNNNNQNKEDSTATTPYRGIVMHDLIDRSGGWSRELKKKYSKEQYMSMVDERMKDFKDYAARGGILVEEDLSKMELVPELLSTSD